MIEVKIVSDQVERTTTMRLDETQLKVICETFQKYFAQTDHIWLFGSRVDDSKKGGDIDLYIETTYNAVEAVSAKLSFLTDLNFELGEQKIDVVLNLISSKAELPIYDIAKSQGVRLL